MVHAYGGEGLDNCIRAGVKSIEHGTFLTEEQAAQMSVAGMWLVPTVSILEDDIRCARDGTFAPHIAAKALTVEPPLYEVAGLAHAHGVRIALGSDAVRRDLHGRNLAEIPALARSGLPAAECLRAATVGGAELLGIADERGAIEVGRVADLILLDEDPSDCTVFDRTGSVTGVIQGGRVEVVHPCLD
jgi:imidazolonepropionase-like amidohydrolase